MIMKIMIILRRIMMIMIIIHFYLVSLMMGGDDDADASVAAVADAVDCDDDAAADDEYIHFVECHGIDVEGGKNGLLVSHAWVVHVGDLGIKTSQECETDISSHHKHVFLNLFLGPTGALIGMMC